MANTDLDIILSSMGRSQDPGYDDILSGMGGSQPGGPIVISLNALLLSSTSFLTGGATSVGILNKTAGSAIAATSSDGTALSVSGSTLTGTFTAAGTPNITLVETLAGATNSPRSSVVGVSVAASGAAPLTVLFVGSSTPAKYFTEFTGPSNSQVTTSTDGTNFAALGTTGAGATNFGDALQKLLNRPIRLLNKASAGTKLKVDWEPASSTLRASAVAAATAAGGDLVVISIVGFNDANLASVVVPDEPTHEALLRSFFSRMRTETGQSGLKIAVGGSQRYTGAANGEPEAEYTYVRGAEVVVANDAPNFWGAHAYDLPQLSDGIHMTQAGYVTHANRLAVNVANAILGATIERGPRVTAVTAVYNTATDVTLAHSTGTDFTPLTGITAFELSFDNFSTTTAISAAVHTDATHIRLTHAASGGAAPSVRLLYGSAPSISGIVKDNSTRTLPINPTVTALTASAGSTVTDPAAGGGTTPTAKTAQVHFTHTSAAATGAGWNDIAALGDGPSGQSGTTGQVVTLSDTSGAATGWTLTTTTASQAANNSAGGSTTIYPAVVATANWFNGDSAQSQARVASTTHTLTGLNPAKKYSLGFYGNRGVASPTRSTTYTAGGKTVTQTNNNNTATVSTLTDLVPDANGALTYTYAPSAAATNFGYLNALIITEQAA